jgi:hypothetical protein
MNLNRLTTFGLVYLCLTSVQTKPNFVNLFIWFYRDFIPVKKGMVVLYLCNVSVGVIVQ